MSRSSFALVPVLAFLVALAACGADPDARTSDARSTAMQADTVPSAPGRSDLEPERAQALDVALDSLEAFVVTLEQINGPVAAWNRAEAAARLLRYLEQNRAAFALDMPEDEAARRYPERMSRLEALEARRTAALARINEDPVAARVLVEEMAKADAAAAGR